MVIIEGRTMDEPGKKVNSLLKTSSQKQADPEEFAQVIQRFKSASVGRDLLVTARIESLNVRIAKDDAAEKSVSLQASLRDALLRAEAYTDAGADAIMIHSKSPSPDEVLEFSQRFRATDAHMPLVVVPTTYSSMTRGALTDAGADVVIYTNHLMWAKIKVVASISDQMTARTLDLFMNDTLARACLKAHNYGCLLRLLLEQNSWDDWMHLEAQHYLFLAQKLAVANMVAAVEELALGELSGCEADVCIILVKDLLRINVL